MTDNLGPLRQAMSDLAEHGGGTDMYERSLRRSKQVQRRNSIATGVAAAVVVFAVAGAIPFLAGNHPNPSTPVATQAPTPSIVVPTSEPPSVSPTSPAPGTTDPGARPSSKKPPSSPTSKRPHNPSCPSAKTLERVLPDDEALPKDWHFPASSVECWQTWASAYPEGPNTGDGIYLFHYKAGTGWRYHSQGSGYQCKDLGIDSSDPPFCD